MNEDEDTPVITLDAFMGYLVNAFAALGMIATAAFVGLWFGGFFHFLASKYPEGFLAYLLGVV